GCFFGCSWRSFGRVSASTGGMRVLPSSMATSFTSGCGSFMAAILPPKRPDAPPRTSTAIEASLAGPAVGGLRRVDPEDSPEPPPSRRGDDHRVAAAQPLHPTEIEVPPGERSPDGTRDVGTSLGPIEAEPAEAAAGRTPRGQRNPEPGQKPGAGRRDLRALVVERHVFAGP